MLLKKQKSWDAKAIMIELSKLESHLWEAANILRGPVDEGSKTYIFPLLFFKRISDAYDEEKKRRLLNLEGILILLSCLNSIASSSPEVAIGKMYESGHPILVRPCIDP